MSRFSSLSIAVSGMNAAQAALYVTGHNMSNSATVGYSRQQVMQTDFTPINVGVNGLGVMQMGLGTNVAAIRQVRDKFLDESYRFEVKRVGFYSVKTAVGQEVESILGELEGEYAAQRVLEDMWDAINELSLDLSGIGTRGTFINTAVSFVNKANDVYEKLFAEQNNLNQQIKDTVFEVNSLVERVNQLNIKIMQASASGDRPNDFLDERNYCLDRLAMLMDIDVTEGRYGQVDITSGGNELLVGGFINKIGLKYTAKDFAFVEPVFTRSETILPYTSNAKPLYNLTGQVNAIRSNDNGTLKALLVARGSTTCNYASYPIVPKPPTVPTPITAPTKPDAADFGGDLQDPAYLEALGQYEEVDLPKYQKDYVKYQNDLAKYEKDFAQFEKEVIAVGEKYKLTNVPQKPNPADYPGLDTDPAYIAALSAYKTEIVNYANIALEKTLKNIPDYQRDVFNATQAIIPRVQMEFDALINNLVKMINEAVAPTEPKYVKTGNMVDDGFGNLVPELVENVPYFKDGTKNEFYSGPYALDKETQGIEVFVRKGNTPRFNPETGEPIYEDKTNMYSLYTIGNIEINPIFAEASGYTFLCLSPSRDVEDTNLILDLMYDWKFNFGGKKDNSVERTYAKLVNGVATETRESETFLQSQTVITNQVNNIRLSMSGVSLDEELTNMMKFQHAYNSAAKILNVIDEMIDKIVNGTGIVGR